MRIIIISLFLLMLLIQGCSDSCPDGFEGNSCDIESRDKFIGIWNSDNYNCALGEPFSIEIQKGTAINDINIGIQGSFSLKVVATVDTDKFLTTPETLQIDSQADSIIVSGSFESEKLIFNLDNLSTSRNCRGEFEK